MPIVKPVTLTMQMQKAIVAPLQLSTDTLMPMVKPKPITTV